MTRLCACGCGESLDGRRKDVRYVSVAHKQRGYRKHLATDLEAAGLPSHLNRSVIPAIDAQPSRRRSGRQISYAKAVAAAKRAVFLFVAADPDEVQQVVEHELRRALPKAQR